MVVAIIVLIFVKYGYGIQLGRLVDFHIYDNKSKFYNFDSKSP